MSIAKYYPQTDLHVALMFLVDVHNDITLVVDKSEYFPYIRREIINVLGVPSWNEPSRLRYSAEGKSIRLVSMNSQNYQDRLRGIPGDSIFIVEGWNVNDIRHSPYCVCNVPLVTTGYYHGIDGRLHASVLCDECGKRVVDVLSTKADKQMPKA